MPSTYRCFGRCQHLREGHNSLLQLLQLLELLFLRDVKMDDMKVPYYPMFNCFAEA